jgi:hypothetical protein
VFFGGKSRPATERRSLITPGGGIPNERHQRITLSVRGADDLEDWPARDVYYWSIISVYTRWRGREARAGHTSKRVTRRNISIRLP